MKVAFLKREYEKKIFSKGQLTQFAQRLAGFCDFPPTDLGIIIHEKSADAETSRRCALSDLMNICEIGKTMSCLAFHSDLNIIKLRFQLNSQAITITYNIKGNIENARQIVFLTEDTLELTRLSEEALSSQREFIEIDESLFVLMQQVYEKEKKKKNSAGSFDEYFNQVIKMRCQEGIDDWPK
ncbi:hypothetical protein Desor_2722 [Desulfosporosinus orientis DSM 765]|uniref:Uncharacterized protein n=1 Tax=Desulfosporosinus orientis (strain ATCC 19365 / DSM 765 / NCIMB 8382 / VKM B-1628 / Singapore I) TaxID=768706 RepID=G7WBD5_DESOD|nr:hypothetical protein [Desulfosporosinus orientis]AET68264.1 hypothetical protein Desor_2722 [Desulfosporosinus orientis DSM 765]